MHHPRYSKGFSLTELAIVLVIVALLIGGMIMPLGSQNDLAKMAETKKALSEIREALIAYAVINNKLPCPDSDTDPAAAGYGFADATCPAGTEGRLPWKTLGVTERDAWGSPRTATTQPFLGFWLYRVDATFSTTASILTNTNTSEALRIRNASAQDINNSGDVVALVYSTGANLTANGDNAPPAVPPPDAIYQSSEQTSDFDDQLVWISKPVLIGRLISAGKSVSP